MQIEPFKLERYFAEYEFNAPHLLCCSDCESLSIGDVLDMEPGAEDELKKLWLGYTQSKGAPLLREQIAALYPGISPDQILVHTGAEEAIFNTMNAVLQKGDHVIVHYPCYQSLMEVAASLGCETTLWKTYEHSDWALDLAVLKKNIRPNTRLVVINCPHNPTGYVMASDAFAELVELSQKHGFMIFSDEVYRFLEYDAQDRLPSICEVDDRGVALGVMSKAFGLAGLRIGWIATRNRQAYEKIASFKDYTTICNSAPAEFLSMIALKHKNRILSRNLNRLKNNLAALNRFFQKYPDMFQWTAPKAGPIAFPSLRKGAVDQFCHDLVTRAGVLLLPGTLYDASCPNFRIGFGRANMVKCLRKFDDYLQQ
ncbi:MAG: aminotransferase class I/II-fold pyridoxal phosphate-dependent enzyme [Desulfobacterales bacterium]|nr:aminotransferase class I/II-fold pyridoxal phosphate-dependent enzyme [Desulfobacterales bacterium]MDD4071760.1 aminotransferase class I/II-fold pyridoxal phosphate-dependent enzyme [Desulfobacterales bacterium]MDD4391970.1 aminotransferase class I/II-fold pyridoxal phosphate-dependent enzyme [Desulfobacterales bacterium]